MLVSSTQTINLYMFEAEADVFCDWFLALRMYFEGLDGGPTQDRVCRGNNENDNFGSYFTVYWTSTLEGCKSQCVEIAECKGTSGQFLPVFFASIFFLSGLNPKHKKNVGLSWEKVTTQWLCCRWFNKHNTLDFLDTTLLHSVFIHYNFLSQSSMHDSRKGVFLATELIFVANMFSTKWLLWDWLLRQGLSMPLPLDVAKCGHVKKGSRLWKSRLLAEFSWRTSHFFCESRISCFSANSKV